MVKSLISLAVLGTLVTPVVYAAETTKTETKEESNWSMTTNMGFVSDYRARGVSQTWRKEAIQAGIDLTHSSGFYIGAFGSNVSPNTYPKANVELDLYAGYNGEIKAVEGLGYTVGAIGYFYPNGSWKKYTLGYRDDSASPPINEFGVQQTPQGGRWDTYEANAGISYKWVSAKGSVTLGDWYGAEQSTGWTKSTRGTTYLELNAAIPTPLDGLTLIGHVGRLDVNGELNTAFTSPGASGPSVSTSMATKPDYTDYKVGLSYAFKVLNADGWNAGLYYIGHNNDNYWGSRGYGGTSFNGATLNGTSPESKNLNKDAAVFTLGRTF